VAAHVFADYRAGESGAAGRAGGGEELGGLRGLSFYLQRTALSGDRALLDAITGAGRK
jgi:hypothetical protein